jgi:hypothetical protein
MHIALSAVSISNECTLIARCYMQCTSIIKTLQINFLVPAYLRKNPSCHQSSLHCCEMRTGVGIQNFQKLLWKCSINERCIIQYLLHSTLNITMCIIANILLYFQTYEEPIKFSSAYTVHNDCKTCYEHDTWVTP